MKFPKGNSDVLFSIPNIGPRIVVKMNRLGVRTIPDLVNRDPDEMIDALNAMDGFRHDPCLRDAFEAAIEYARTGNCEKWWYYSRKRKAGEKPEGSTKR